MRWYTFPEVDVQIALVFIAPEVVVEIARVFTAPEVVVQIVFSCLTCSVSGPLIFRILAEIVFGAYSSYLGLGLSVSYFVVFPVVFVVL